MCLSACLSVYQSVYQSVYLSCLSIYLACVNFFPFHIFSNITQLLPVVKVVWVSSGNSEEEFYWNACVIMVPLHGEQWERKQKISRAVGTPFPQFPHHFKRCCCFHVLYLYPPPSLPLPSFFLSLPPPLSPALLSNHSLKHINIHAFSRTNIHNNF